MLDDINGRSLVERGRLFDAWFDDLTELYAGSDDGYVRQSAVRVAEQLVPGLVAATRGPDGRSTSSRGSKAR